MRKAPWSEWVCFAGLGPGEVTVEGRKVVGLSQRRTREAALFQCCAARRWEPARLLELLALDEEERAKGGVELADVATGIGAVAGLVDGLLEALCSR
jgi:lipoate-protein ligase A